MIDLHTHHERCGHAAGRIAAYADVALRRGLRTLGVTDHAPLLLASGADEPAPGMHMPASAWNGYLDEATALQARLAGRLEVLVGVEADYIPGREAAYRALLDDRRLDVVLGSVHYVDGFHVYDRTRWSSNDDVDAAYARYHELVRAAAATRMFDVMAHIDAMKARAPRPPSAPEREWDATVAALRAADVAVEINTSGYRKCGEPFPAWGLIERLHAAGVPLTFGSDAHRPEEVHHGWQDVLVGLRALGVRTLAVVRARSRHMVPLEAVTEPA